MNWLKEVNEFNNALKKFTETMSNFPMGTIEEARKRLEENKEFFNMCTPNIPKYPERFDKIKMDILDLDFLDFPKLSNPVFYPISSPIFRHKLVIDNLDADSMIKEFAVMKYNPNNNSKSKPSRLSLGIEYLNELRKEPISEPPVGERLKVWIKAAERFGIKINEKQSQKGTEMKKIDYTEAKKLLYGRDLTNITKSKILDILFPRKTVTEMLDDEKIYNISADKIIAIFEMSFTNILKICETYHNQKIERGE